MKKLPILTRTLLSVKKDLKTIIEYWIINVDTDKELKLIDNYNSEKDITKESASTYIIGYFKNIPIYASDLLLYGDPYDIPDKIKNIIETKILNPDQSNWTYTDIDEKNNTYTGMSERYGIDYFKAVIATLNKPKNIVVIKIKKSK